jgi:DNA-directed RNA polymerase subunit RPC12/RpoP
MFKYFNKDELDSTLNCPRCHLKYLNPRIISPCFETLCLKCIEEISDEKSEVIECPFCNAKHEIPAGGFFPNKAIVDLLTIRASEVFTSVEAKKLGKSLKRLANLIDKVEETVANSRLELEQECLHVKHQIDLAIKKKLQDVDDIRDDFHRRIDENEELERQAKNIDIDEEREFIHDVDKYLESLKSTEQDLEEINDQVEECFLSLSRKLKVLESASSITFNTSNQLQLDEKIIGSIQQCDENVSSRDSTVTASSSISASNLGELLLLCFYIFQCYNIVTLKFALFKKLTKIN